MLDHTTIFRPSGLDVELMKHTPSGYERRYFDVNVSPHLDSNCWASPKEVSRHISALQECL